MNYRSLLIACLATLGLAVAGWGQADGKDVELSAGIGQAVTSSGEGAWVVGAIRRLTNDSDWDWKPSWSPDGTQIAFQSSRDGNYEIYVMDSDGSNPRRLTDHPAEDWFPSWSPDGRHIAYVSGRDSNYAIYAIGSDGSNPRNLTNDSYRHYYPSWSPDGRHIAFVTMRNNKAAIYVMDSDGSNRRFLTIDPGQPWSPSWSPDGRHIAFQGHHDIYVMGSDGSDRRNPRRLTDHPAWGRASVLVPRRPVHRL